MSGRKVVIGIDLGTTCSCVGVFQNGRVDIIADSETGQRTTPSVAAFTDDGRLIGQAAKAQVTFNPMNTIFEVKRLIGRKFDEPSVQSDREKWPFEITSVGNTPRVKVQHRSSPINLAPEQVSAMVLSKMKTIADTYLGRSICDTVITVPAYFNDSQRQATKDAGTIAGLNVLKIINEPTAAAIAYGVDRNVVLTRRFGNSKKILVFDLGGGTFDVAVVTVNHLSYTVEAVGGDSHLGGGDFDNLLLSYLVMVIKSRYFMDVSANQKAMGRLKCASEEAKINLSSMTRTQISIPGLLNGEDFEVVVTRNIFERLCKGLFQQTIGHVRETLHDAGLAKTDIDEVILVGGSTRIPMVQQMVTEFFDGKPLNRTINPDEAVAYGAAIVAAIASGEHSVPQLTFTDVTPLSLGLRNADGSMVVSIKRNTKIPVSVSESNWTTTAHYQTSGRFDIYEGEEPIATNNNHLGRFTLTNLEVATRGVPKLAAQFSVDANGILQVSAVDLKTGSCNGVTIASEKGRLDRAEVARMVRLEREFEAGHQFEAGQEFEAGHQFEAGQEFEAGHQLDAGQEFEAAYQLKVEHEFEAGQEFSGESEIDEEEEDVEDDEEEEIFSGSLLELKRHLETYCFSLKLSVGCVSDGDTIAEAERQVVVELCDAALDWVEENRSVTATECGHRLRLLKTECIPLTRKLAYSC